MSTPKATLPLQVVGATVNPIVTQVWQLAQPLCLSEGVELVHVEYQREQAGRILRLYIDKPGGVTLDDCADISRQVGDLLDVSLASQSSYRLEVSSPGSKRPLGRLEDFERYAGRRVKLRTAQAIDGQKNFTGTLDGVSETEGQTMIHLCRENRESRVAIAFDSITKAQLLDGENACL